MKFKPILFYTLFFTTFLFLFLFLLFPQKQVAASLSRLLSTSSVSLSIDEVKPGLPFKFYFKNTKVLIDESTEIAPDSFEVFFGPSFIFNRKKPIKFQSDFYQGSINGSLYLNRMDPLLFSQAELSMSGVEISDFRLKTDFADMTLGCELNGQYNQMEKPDKKNSGQGSIIIKSFSAIMKDSLFNILNLPSIDFADINIEFTHSLQRVTITQCTARGSIINVKLKGIMDMVSPLQKTRLNLRGTILKDSPYLENAVTAAIINSAVKTTSKDGIGFSIEGTLENPKIGI